MKPLIILIVLAFLVSSCTNEEKPDEPATVPISRETELKESIKKYPDSLSLKEYLIQYYRSNNNYDMALATANEVLQKDSSLARFWEMKATLYFENYDTVNAIKAYEKLLDIYPAPQYVMELGSLYAATKILKHY
ncbi:MAG: hypothetical protein IPJ81_10860 [Chitinophagaceae bacterium]|nr:hypothetical protein [Chitinophagaceae bacterium]